MPGTGDKISVLGFGCMRLPTESGSKSYGADILKEEAARQIHLAIDGGVNYLDTAQPYHEGNSESFLGDYVLKDGYREKVYLATKLPCWLINTYEDMEYQFSQQLKRLRVDYIDYYMLHALDGKVWDKMYSLGVTDFMDSLLKDGRIRHIGFSFHGILEDFKRITDAYNWNFTQVQYNIIDEYFQAGIDGIKYAHAKNIGVIVMEPLRGGSLAEDIPDDVQNLYSSAPVRRTPAEWALRWVLNRPEVTLLLSGMNSQENILENIRVASEAYPDSLSENEVRMIEEVRKCYLSHGKCTECGYCMPCPAGIDIPDAMKNPDKNIKAAGLCLDCGVCETKCPQGIKIREMLKKCG
jgi:predicted aldo/keto reductase-like oxidoreductase